MITLAGLFVYPVKSCRGTGLDAATLTDAGLEHDREWMIVTPDGRFLTQREEPRLACIATRLESDALWLCASGAAPLEVPFRRAGTATEVVVWRERCRAHDEGAAAARWLEEFLGRSLRLVRFDDAHHRRSDGAWTGDGLRELGKKFNLLKGRDFRASVRRIQRHSILVVGSFIIGLDIDEPGIGQRIAEAASQYGVDTLNTLFLTPLPGTRLWEQMKSEDRLALTAFPEDWKYYTLTFPVARFKHLSLDGIIQEMNACNRDFYSLPRLLRRVWGSLWQRRKPLVSLVGNLSYRNNSRVDCRTYADFQRQRRDSSGVNPMQLQTHA